MKGSTKVFRLILTAILMLTISLVVAACGNKNTDELDVAAAKEVLVIGYQSPDSEASVTRNLTLATTGLNEVSISWVSSHPAIVTQAGVVTRPTAADTEVTLTATLTKGDESDTKIFTVTVIKVPVVTTPQEALDAIVITGDDLVLDGTIYSTTKNIVLPTTSLGLDVNWESSSTAISANGTVTRPAYGENNVRVILTAYVGSADKDFVIDVLAITVMPVAEVLSKAKTQLVLGATEVVENITLPTSIIVEGEYDELYTASVSWASSHPNHISATGSVTRPALEEPDVVVTLTGTITYLGQTETKDIQIRVLADAEPYEEVDTFAEAEALFLDTISSASDRVYIKVLNVSLIGKMDDGLMFIDSEGAPFFAFGSTSNAYNNAQFGVLYDVLGNFADYFGVTQINGTGSASSRQPTILIEKDGDPIEPDPTIVENIADYLPATMPTYSLTNRFAMEYLTVDAKVYIKSTVDNYGVFLLDVDYNGDYSDIDASGTSVPYSNNGIVIYYTSNKDALIPLNGLTVTIDIVIYGLRDDRLIYNAVFLGDIDDIIVHEMTDAQAVAAVKQTLGMTIPEQIVEPGTINLPTSMLGTTIVWTTDNADIISVGGVVTPVDGERNAVKLTATITKGDQTDEIDITVLVGELPVLSIEDALAITTKDVIKVKGTVVGYVANDTLAFHDETGAVTLFVGGQTLSEAATILRGAIGKVVIVEGSRNTYNGLEQIEKILSAEVVATETPHFEKADITDVDWDPTTLLPYQGKLISITEGVISKVTIDSYDNITVEITIGEKTINMKWDARVAITGGANRLLTALEGDLIDVVDAPLGWVSNKPLIGYYVANQAVITENPDLEKYEVTFMDDENVIDTIEVTDGRIIPAEEYPRVIKPGFKLSGWFTDEELLTAWDPATIIEADTVLYAKFEEAVEVIDVYSFADLDNATSYVTTPTEFSVNDLDLIRMNANISASGEHKGVVLGIRTGNSWGSPYLEIKDPLQDVTKVVFNITNWTTDAQYNLDYADGIYIQTSVDGTTWVDSENFKTGWDTGSLASNNIELELFADVYVRLFVRSAGTQEGTYQLRLIVKSIEIHSLRPPVEEAAHVTFDLNYGEEDPTVVTIEAGEKVTRPSNPTREDFNFLGWYLDEAVEPFDFNTAINEDITLYARWEAVALGTIADALAKPAGFEVIIEGVVSGFTAYTTFGNYDKVWIEDGTGAITVYRGTFPETLAIGDKFTVRGKVAAFNGLIQIAQGSTLTYVDSGNALIDSADILDIDELTVDKVATRVNLSGTVVSISGNGRDMVVKVGEKNISLRAIADTGAINTHILTGSVGQQVNLKDIQVDWFNGPQLLPTLAAQVEFIGMTDAQKVAAAKDTILDYFDGKSFDMGTQIVIDEEGLHDVTVDFETDPVGALDEEGKWMDVVEDTVVIFTVTITLGAEEEEFTFSVTIKFAEEDTDVVLYETGFEDVTGTNVAGYASGEVLSDGKSWILSDALIGNLGDDKKNDDKAVRFRAPGIATLLVDFENVTKISFYYGNYGSLTIGRLSLWISNDEGDTWTEIWTQADAQSILTQEIVVIDYDELEGFSEEDSIRFEFRASEGGTVNNHRLNIDDIKVYGNPQ
ncbi:MAG: immunoglobulin-like domain-containing protein [Acholeplasmataceae bacterium]